MKSKIDSRQAALHLLELLDQEKNALEHNDVEALEAVIVGKTTAIDRLKQTLTPSNPVTLGAVNPGVVSTDLTPILQQCRDLNNRNQRLATARQKAVSVLLATIRGEDDSPGPVYGKDGHLRTAISSSLGNF